MKLNWCAVLVLKTANALDCWTCEEKSYSDCVTYGRKVTCPLGDNEDQTKRWTCSLMESQRHGNRVNHVVAGCKQYEACLADWQNNGFTTAVDENGNPTGIVNDLLRWHKKQCYFEDKRKVSKCRQCCADSNECNKAWVDLGVTAASNAQGLHSALTDLLWGLTPTAPTS